VRLLRHGTSPQILCKTADRPGFHSPTAETSRKIDGSCRVYKFK
jgi:hypothetical protein